MKGSVPPGDHVEVDPDGAGVVDVVDVGFPWTTSVTLNVACKVGAFVGADRNGGSVRPPDTARSAVTAFIEVGAVVGVLDAVCPAVVVPVGVEAAVEVTVVLDVGTVGADTDVVVPAPADPEVDVVETGAAAVVV